MYTPTQKENATMMMRGLICAAMFSIIVCAVQSLADNVSMLATDKITINQELRARLDSIELEKQTRKRQGKPIDDLETAGAQIRDSLQNMRDAVADAYRTNPQAFDDDKKGFTFSLTGMFPNLPEVVLSFRPEGLFDWVMVITGAVAVLSLITLIFGIFAGRRRRRKEQGNGQDKGKKKIVARKMDLGTNVITSDVGNNTRKDGNLSPAADNVGNQSGDSVDNLQSLMEHLRKLTPQTQTPPTQSAPPPPSEKHAPHIDEEELPPMPSTPPPPPKPKEPPPPPPPLIVNVPDLPVAAALDKSAGETVSVNDLVISAAGSGMSEQEISRRYQVSVDQVRLILRMNQ